MTTYVIFNYELFNQNQSIESNKIEFIVEEA